MNSIPVIRRPSCAILALGILGLAAIPQLGGQGIPEPSLILYGTIRNTAIFNARVTAGTLRWTLNRQQGSPRTNVFVTSLSNVVGQFSYVLEVPCETQIGFPVSSNVVELLPTPLDFNRAVVTLEGSPLTFVIATQSLVRLSSRSRGTIERVDFTMSAPCVDLDGLGLCDEWETRYFGSIGYAPGGDEDGDGMTNLQEFIAGTNPNDGSSVFRFVSAERQEGGFLTTWNSAEGRSYSLLRSGTLLPGSFSLIRSNIPATPPTNTLLDTNALGAGPYFYDLFIEP